VGRKGSCEKKILRGNNSLRGGLKKQIESAGRKEMHQRDKKLREARKGGVQKGEKKPPAKGIGRYELAAIKGRKIPHKKGFSNLKKTNLITSRRASGAVRDGPLKAVCWIETGRLHERRGTPREYFGGALY